MEFSSRTIYALKFMLHLALENGHKILSINEVATKESISVKFLENVVATIKSSGLIKVKRGAKGGYLLAKSTSLISLKEIIELFEPLESSNQEPTSATTNIDLTIRKQMKDIEKTINKSLQEKTLKDLVTIFETTSSSQMFYI
jgi:Rrf2 family protein